MSQKIRELVLWNERPNGVSWRVNHGDVVETIADTNLFCNVAGVENVWSNWRAFELNLGFSIRRSDWVEAHLDSGLVDLFQVEWDTKKSGDVFDFNFEGFSVQSWCLDSAEIAISFINDVDWLNGELGSSLTVFREL